jgi:hypothetical protein
MSGSVKTGDWQSSKEKKMTPWHLLYKQAIQGNKSLEVVEDFEDACVGVGYVFKTGIPLPVLVYDSEKAIDIIMKERCMEWEEAVELFETEIAKNSGGEGAPMWLEFGYNQEGCPKLSHVHGRTGEVRYIFDKKQNRFVINEDNVVEVDFVGRQKIDPDGDEFTILP